MKRKALGCQKPVVVVPNGMFVVGVGLVFLLEDIRGTVLRPQTHLGVCVSIVGFDVAWSM